MAKKAQLPRQAPSSDLITVIRRFLASCRRPILIESGEDPIPLVEGRYDLESRGSGCVLHVWGEEGNLVRRVVEIKSEKKDRLDLLAGSFGRTDIRLALVDEATQVGRVQREAGHARFREFLRRILFREYRDRTLSHFSSAPDLEHTLSPSYVRGALHRGREMWALIAAPPGLSPSATDQILSFGLIWFDHLRSRETDYVFAGLKIFVPQGRARSTANRLAWLNPHVLQSELIEYDRTGRIRRFDKQDYGNLSTELRPCLSEAATEEHVAAWLQSLRSIPGVETVRRADGLLSLRVRGATFATAGRGSLTYGLENPTPVGPQGIAPVLRLARELARYRSPDAQDKQNPLYRRHPETWLESQVRRRLELIDGNLLSEPLYGQVPSVAGPDRGIIDLLASDRQGRLAVIELKASEDVHLPLQALDYWMRVKWNLDRDEFQACGYFPDVMLAEREPRLILVAPAMDFHPTTETVLKYVSPVIDVERIGVGAAWRQDLRVVFRRRGSARLA